MTEEAFALAPVDTPPTVRPLRPEARDTLLTPHNLSRYETAMQQGIGLVRRTLQDRSGPFTGILPHELATAFQDIDLDQCHEDLDAALTEVERLYLRDAVHFDHPRYVAHLNCPVAIPALLGELILSAINTSVDTWDQSAGATFIEQKLLDWSAAKIGLGDLADGIFTSGGTQSNLMALLLARDRFCAARQNHLNKQHGLPESFNRLRIFTSELSHFSVQKAAAILGLGYDAVVPVPCDRYFRMDSIALQQQIDDCRDQGLQPMAVVATAGTTDFGSIDPLPEIAAICRRHDLWLHADAAYGCGLLVSPKYRHWLAGIEQADSVTLDYHKSFLQPVSCSALLVRDKQHLSAVTYYAEYLNPLSQLQEGTPNLVNKSMQTTRRFDALKLWLTLRTLGARGIGEAFDQVIHLTRQAYLLLLSEPGIEVLHQPRLSTLVFRYNPRPGSSCEEVDAANAAIRKSLSRSGEAVIAGTRVGSRQYLKFTLLNPATAIGDIQAVVKLIRRHGDAWFSVRENQQQPVQTKEHTDV
ncbi:pyridoxal phosphate-dependent decarboxylase family protein [Marinobacterium rhizophilum]|uniref:pyridoxal phosphate-dependent decarboxylase family protein n=1 Tax=Marinobacterium rhizophilum TaxID=420402 RepID=UPI000368228C|nr:aspartate aminotransferase family protein [Marinobacterium rhizophilum]